MSDRYRILLVDDNRAIHDDFRKILEHSSDTHDLDFATASLFELPLPAAPIPSLELDSAFQGQEALVRVQESLASRRPYSLAFVDVRMPPGWDGIETVIALWQVAPDLQVVICTAYSDYSWAEIIKRLGHSDQFLILKKPFDTVEVRQLAYSLTRKWMLSRQLAGQMLDLQAQVSQRTSRLEEANHQLGEQLEQHRRDIVQRDRAEQAHRESEARFQAILEAVPDAIIITDARGIMLLVNTRAEQQFGYSRHELVGQPVSMLVPERYRTKYRGELSSPPLTRMAEGLGFIGQRRDQTEFSVEVCLNPLATVDGELLVSSIRDVSERIELETQLRQSQKLDAVGQLAAGVAHDFNNLLTIILCHASDLAADLHCNAGMSVPIQEIQQAAEGAANLTRQLLMFSRKQTLQPVVLDLPAIIRGIGRMLGRLLREDIQLDIDPGLETVTVLADPGMMEQVLINLAVNARDAMPQGGKLSIRACRALVPRAAASHWPDAAGEFCACFSVTDTGTGMEPHVMERMFDPFFTTKEPGRGTGLGLSTIHGIIRQHRGWIGAESEPGRGSTFTVCLPLARSDTLEVGNPATSPDRAAGGHETILLVEDEPTLGRLARIILQRLGYVIIEAGSGEKALPLWQAHRHEIDLLVTDLVMPDGLDGMKLARILQEDKPGLKVIYCSGYSEDVVQGMVAVHEGTNFLRKPYHPNALATIVRNSLDRVGL